jgi:hypothetical protein
MNYLPADLQTKQNEVNSQLAAAREATQAAQKAQAELNAEIRERTK